jgi:hypothetical protein
MPVKGQFNFSGINNSQHTDNELRNETSEPLAMRRILMRYEE